MKVQFSGSMRHRLMAIAGLGCSLTRAWLRRVLRGPRRPGWNWAMELGTEVFRAHLATALSMPVEEARCFLDSLQIESPALSQVHVTPISEGAVTGSWFVPHDAHPNITVLYLHGGGYSFYSKSQAGLIAMFTLAARSRTFAADYRLSPEHRFPAQLEDAVKAYQWLLDRGVDPRGLVIAGDSAGGNLAIALLLAARDRNLPLPRLAIAMSPPLDFSAADKPLASDSTLIRNEPFDWIQRDMLLKWADWFCSPSQHLNPLVSPMYADLRGLPPIYLQAGRAEILYDGIEAFANCAKQKGANLVLESWDDMNHNFQMFGNQVPQSAEALRRLGEVIHEHVVD